MNVLEKILEEIEEKRESLVDMSDDEPELCDVEDWYDEGVKAGRMKAYLDVAETIRSHMGEVLDMYGKRLIDANALDEEVRNFFLAITGNPKQATVVKECKESFRRMIDEQPTVYEANDWIPVEERLPDEYDGLVLAQVSGKPKENITLDNALELAVHIPREGWILEEYPEWEKPNVIAWQPLPKPYKEGRER